MKKFLQHAMPSVFLLALFTSGMAADRGRSENIQISNPELQYSMPLSAKAKATALQKLSLAKPAAAEIIWQDDFEQGINGWTVESAFDRQTYWHRSTQGAFGNTGFSYWCGDPAINGYDDYWFQLLLTPEIDLTGTTAPILTIKHNFAIESPAGASQSIPQIDGWDGVAVRLSSDGGNTFVPLTPTVAYPQKSLFGFVRAYGFNAPGWGGKSGGWVDAAFNLSAYVGKKVIIRFEFGSDPGFSTEDDATLFGWRVDNLRVADGANTIFFDDGGDTGTSNMTAKVLPPALYWHQVTTRANSPTHSWWCGDDDTGRYPHNIWNYLISPKIFIPATGQNNAQWSKIFLDFQHYYSMEYASQQKFDFFAIEVSNDNGQTWQNPTTFVYVGNSSNRWIPFEGSYTNSFDLTNMAGDSIQLRWHFYSDYSVNDIGFFLDDPMIVGVSGLPNDVSVTDFDVAYPNIAGLPIKTFVEVTNIGINDQATVPLWYQINNETAVPVPPQFSVPSGGSSLRDFIWTPPTPGDYHLTVFTKLSSDDDPSNDTLSTLTLFDTPVPIPVSSPGAAILGYEDRYNASRLALTNRVVHFTPKTDIAGLSSYDIQAVAVAFVNQGNQTDRLRVMIGTAATPTTFATILLDREETIQPGDFSFHPFDLSAIAIAKNLTGDFLVKIDYTASNGNANVVLDGGTRFTGHNYFLNPNTQAFEATNFGAFVLANITYLTTSVEERTETMLPQQFKLYANYPNPIQSATLRAADEALHSFTQIRFDLPKASHVRITVYDLMGRVITTLLDERRPAGQHQVRWNLRGVPAGMYFYKMEAENFKAVRKMLIL
jgi:hypothetical protein